MISLLLIIFYLVQLIKTGSCDFHGHLRLPKEDCLLTSTGETYQGSRDKAHNGEKLTTCLKWTLSNWQQFNLQNMTQILFAKKYDVKLDSVIPYWLIHYEIKVGNKCRNPGGILRHPSCLTTNGKSIALSPCKIPYCSHQKNNKT